MGTQARTRLSASNIFCRSTVRSRTSGNFFIGWSVTGSLSLSIKAEQACRTLPLMIIVQDPHTSSRQAASQAGGVVVFPSVVTGLRWICISTEMTLAFGRRSTWNSSHREGWPGPSLRSILTMTLSGMISIVMPGLLRENGVLQAPELLELHPRPLRGPGAHAVPQPPVVARLPRRHELGVVGGLGGLRFRKDELRLVVAAPALVAQTRRLQDQVGDLQHVPQLLAGGEQRPRDVALRLHVVARVADHRRTGDHARVDAGEQRVRAQAVGAVVRVVALACGV